MLVELVVIVADGFAFTVIITDTGEEEPEDRLALKFDESFELPFPLQKEAGEEEDGWSFKDDYGKTFLKLRFKL